MANDISIYYTSHYHGREFPFHFRLVNYSGDYWRAYILSQPDYRGRSESFVVTHRLSDARGRYICWDTPLTLNDLKKVISVWCNCTVYYIHHGGDFTKIAARLTGQGRNTRRRSR